MLFCTCVVSWSWIWQSKFNYISNFILWCDIRCSLRFNCWM